MALERTRDLAAPRRSRLLGDLASPPNVLSLSRIVMLWVAAALFLAGHTLAGLAVGVVAGVTDYLDGYLARRLHLESEIGAILDRLSDLTMESTAFVIILNLRVLPAMFLIAYLFREFVVMSVRIWGASRGIEVSSSLLGKLKTNFLLYAVLVLYLAVSGLITNANLGEALLTIGRAGVGAGLLFSYASGAQYVAAFVRAYDKE